MEAGISPERNGQSGHQLSWEEVRPGKEEVAYRLGEEHAFFSEALGQLGLDADQWGVHRPPVGWGMLGHVP